MPRKPITTYAGGKGPRQRIWEAIRAHGEGEWTRIQIAIAANVEASTVSTYLQALAKAGTVLETRREAITNVATEVYYRLARDEGLEAPRLKRDGSRVTQGLAQEQMWRTLRLMRGDTNARELAAHASSESVPVPETTAHAYLKALDSAGYLDVTRAAKTSGARRGSTTARYRLKPARNTGPRPPMVCRLHVVYDPNEDQVVHAPPVTDEDAIYGH